jgi:phytanoyl-CoA hydroxylase
MREPALTPEELQQFARAGFLVVPQAASHTRVQALREVIRAQSTANIGPAEYEADLRYPGAPASRDAPGGTTTRRLLQAYARHPAFQDWACSPAVVAPLRQLLGPEVMLSRAHHNCVMTKQPRYSSVTGWHQDIRYWSFERPELVSVWLALGREVSDNGCLSFLPGTHRMDLDGGRLDSALFLREDLPENQALIARQVAGILAPGDAVFFHCRTFHAAGSNLTEEVKLSLVFTYHAADNRPLPGTRSASMPAIAV